VEFTCNTRELDENDFAEALILLADDDPATEPDYEGTVYLPDGRIIHAPSTVSRR
jgi:hypothetical protein